jgi:hypothetical protein
VAEAVAKVYPELVVYGLVGKIETVRYSMLSAMPLSRCCSIELQKQSAELRKQTEETRRQAQQIEALVARTARAEWSLAQARLSSSASGRRCRPASRSSFPRLNRQNPQN